MIDPERRRTTYGYDVLGRVTSHSDPLGTFALSYLGQTNQLARRTLQSTNWDTTWQYGDNLHDRQLAAINHGGLNQPARNYAYTTSPEHRILGLTESVAGSATATWGYGYDQADRLTDALVTPGGAYTYGLDAGDNLLSIQTPPGIATSTYNSLNQIDLRNGQPFTYDVAGNLLDDGRRSYEWDAEQRLVRIRYPGSARFTEFRYDGLGRRTVVREYNGSYNYTETRYLWCGERICQARNASDAVIRRYYDEGEQAVSLTGPTTPYYYAQDHLGSVRDLVNAGGQVLASYDYDPYGNPIRTMESGSARADYRYAGLFYHAPSSLYLTHYRVYDPVTARWLSRDPIGEMGGVNLYGYVRDNPINLTDPTGKEPIILTAAVIWAVAYVSHAGDQIGQPNGSLTDEYASQDNKCSIPIIGSIADKCLLGNCQRHDACYKENQCNATSWATSALGGTKSCNQCNSDFF